MEKLQTLTDILQSGLQSSARVIDIDFRFGTMHRIQHVDLILDMHYPGKSERHFIRTTTILSDRRLPKPGEVISIKYLPQDTTCVVVM